MKLSFYHWLSLQENQVVEIQVARFLEDILDKAATLKKQEMQSGLPNKTYSAYVQKIWPQEFIQNGEFILPNFFPENIAGRWVQFKHKSKDDTADTIHNNGNFEGFIINISPFDVAKSTEEVDRHLSILKSAMHHEAEHIYNIGTSNNGNNHDVAIKYMTNPGEIRAHARQMAQQYAKYFPGEPFDLNKVQLILDKPEFTTTHKNYFYNFANPNIWQNAINKSGYKQENPHNQIMQLVPKFLAQYQN
jgi:hypothetical protein